MTVERGRSRKNSAEADLRARALRFLARREHSRSELQRKLAPFAEDPADLAIVLDDFVRRGWLSDRRAAEQLVHSRRGKFGSARIRQELLRRGIAENAVAEALPGLKDGDVAAARTVWQKKFGIMPRNMAERARQVRFLQGRGFTADVIRRVMKGDNG